MTNGRHLVALRGDEASLYEQHHHALTRAVARRVRMSGDLVEEACQQAWLIRLRRQPDRGPTLFAWLVTVAGHEGHRLSKVQRREASLDAATRGTPDEADRGALAKRIPAPGTVDQSLEARRALRALADLPACQRRFAVLRVSGLSYAEIAEQEGVTYTNVNKHLAKASRRLKDAGEHAA